VSLLDQLTPQNVEYLNSSELTLSVDSEESLRAVVQLTFEKAVSEPRYSSAYARLCKTFSSVSGALASIGRDLGKKLKKRPLIFAATHYDISFYFR